MNEDPAWIAYGNNAVGHEDFLIGNRPGLEALKSAIERALADGQSTIEETGIEFLGVRVVEADPREAAGAGLKGGLLTILRILIFGFLLFVLLVGFVTLAKLR